MQYKSLTLLLLSTLLLTSCYSSMHFADRANSPGFTEQGEFKAAAAIRPQTSDQIPETNASRDFLESFISPELDIAYALTDHFALTGGYTSVLHHYVTEGSFDNSLFNPVDTSLGGSINLQGAEIGGGYFAKGHRAIKYGLYGSFGIGNISRKGALTPQFNYKSQYFKFSIQPEFGLEPGQGSKFSFMAGFRTTMIKYYGFRSDNPLTKYAVGYYDPRYGQDVTNQVYFYFEPYVNLEVGYKYVKFNLQAGFTTGIGTVASDMGDTPYISAGFVFHYDPAY